MHIFHLNNALCILHNARLYIRKYGLPKKPCSMSAPEPCRGQHSKCNDSNAEEVACSSVLCIKASALSNKVLPFSALLLALVLFLMYFPELIT